MWGCIVFLKLAQHASQVPSLYVRVYLNKNKELEELDGSLIICEGVSFPFIFTFFKIMFPHYMWGCIESTGTARQLSRVPSLYVRVYRFFLCVNVKFNGSLIICEGVSRGLSLPLMSFTFPHYMWGCIVHTYTSLAEPPVPSLYVRVYHCVITGKKF